jgi:glycosyltransferase involved in cell wall biosynthesis
MPVFNGEKYLAEAIESVLIQSYGSLELIVVDDGSTDNTAKTAASFGSAVRYNYQHNAGTGAARNKGVETAHGDFLAFVDADDLWTGNKLTLQMNTFNDNLEIEAVFGHVKQFFSLDLDEESKRRLSCPAEIMPGELPSTMLIKRKAFFRVGLFEENWHVGQDVSWILRARERGIRTMMLPDLIYMRRLHKNNKGITHRQFINDRVKILKAHLDSKRRNNR